MYKIGELAALTNTSKRTIDYYTNIGILVPERSQSNYRYYSGECVQVLEMVEQYKKINMPLSEIKTKVELLKADQAEEETIFNHIFKITSLMKHIEIELEDIRPLLDHLNEEQKKDASKKISSYSQTLVEKLEAILS
ncbi:MerR family transcriptional regulator [Bacillus timonensis]|nr:MerR family transcriptional regulator [Bacillus timonensis]